MNKVKIFKKDDLDELNKFLSEAPFDIDADDIVIKDGFIIVKYEVTLEQNEDILKLIEKLKEPIIKYDPPLQYPQYPWTYPSVIYGTGIMDCKCNK